MNKERHSDILILIDNDKAKAVLQSIVHSQNVTFRLQADTTLNSIFITYRNMNDVTLGKMNY